MKYSENLSVNQGVIPVILCGGGGNRLWPLSREHYPKQFLKLTDTVSLFQATVKRMSTITHAKPIIITNEAYRFFILEQLAEIQIQPQDIILEPMGKNTAPAIALAARNALEKNQDALLLILPSDHIIDELDNFTAAIARAKVAANVGKIVTFGIHPSDAKTGYGYIKVGELVGDDIYKIAEFIEKPSRERATAFVNAKTYFWNSGMFLCKGSTYLTELEKYAPDIHTACCEIYASHYVDEMNFMRLNTELFAQCRSESIDYAVMEKTQQGVIAPVNITWSDIGSWESLSEWLQADHQGNVTRGDVVTLDVENSYIHSEKNLIAVLGMRDVIIIDSKDAILVAHKSKSQEVKNIVTLLKEQNRGEAKLPARVYRPWGFYESLVIADNYQVKRLMVKSGASLSLQMHYKRSEHWVVVSGAATVIRGDEDFILHENESTFIPMGCKHRLSNCSEQPLVIIETQTGTYFGEDDIMRFDDIYNRSSVE